jgi:hypothetical protein
LWGPSPKRSRELVLNPGLVIHDGRVSLPSSVNGVVHDYRLTLRARELLELLQSPAARTLPDALVERLNALDVLVPAGSTVGLGLGGLRNRIQRRGYARLPRLLKPTHLAWLSERYRRAAREGVLRRGDSQSDRRWVAHNEPAARLIHHRLTGLVETLAGAPVKPSYVYLASYEEGAELAAHTDRTQCEYSISLLVDYLPNLDGPSRWPLQLHTCGRQVSVFQRVGDGLLYRGRQVRHSRPPLPSGHTSTSLFFHYVDADFVGCLD